jgi:hypothetical protein
MNLVYGGLQLRGIEWVLHNIRPLVLSYRVSYPLKMQ